MAKIKEAKPRKEVIKNKRLVLCLPPWTPPYYGNFAFQLAFCLKFSDPNLQIALICNYSGIYHLAPEKIAFFDSGFESEQNGDFFNRARSDT